MKRECSIKSAACTNSHFYNQDFYRAWIPANQWICSGCRKSRFKTVTKSKAIKEYGLSWNQLKDLKYAELPNPHNKSSSNRMKLYLLKDVAELAIKNSSVRRDKISYNEPP